MNKQLENHITRENIVREVRDFFYKQNFHEIIPPILSSALPLEPNLQPFVTTYKKNNNAQTFYLAMSPERGIKKILALGMENCFAISKSFRNYEQIGTLHSHEFLMLEWYRKNARYFDIMVDVEKLLQTINKKMGNKIAMKEGPFPRVSLNTLFKEKVGLSLEELISSEKRMKEIAEKKGYSIQGATWEELYNQLFVNEIESTFSLRPFFLVDFPAQISPLCKVQKGNPLFAERFELYIHKIEIGNGNTENTDTEDIRKKFGEESERTGLPIDEEFLTSLESMKSNTYAGIGIGIDRLTMLYTNSDIFV
jgi:elongation factor P--beta-lysine ligase